MKDLLKKLWKNEDGVALAFGITFFLLVYLLGMSVYAVGETVRQRMELQNAADAAAYSAAVVQADTLSRIACINKAMSWTYVMLNRRCMDYATDKWLEKVTEKWDEDLRSVRESWNWQSTCGTRIEGVDYRVGISAHKIVQLNSLQANIDEVKMQRQSAAGQGKSYHALAGKITMDRQTLAAMRKAEQALLDRLPKRIENAVSRAVKENISETPNDTAAGGAEISHVLLQNAPDTYMETLRNTEEHEKIFLTYGKFAPDVREISRRGMDRWWVRSGSGEGLQREYRQGGSLMASWSFNGTKYVYTGEACVPFPKAGASQVLGSEVQDGYFACQQPAEPYRLKECFFGEKGSLVVGVKRKLNNPFSFLFSDGTPQGLFSAFTVKDGRSMWAVSAARASYVPPGGSGQKGAYETTFLTVPDQDTWNLCESDWDAVFIPVSLAFDDAKDRNYRKSGREVLSSVYSKLSPGSLSAPPGMSGSFDLSGGRKALVH